MQTNFSSKSLLDPTQQKAEETIAKRLTGNLGQYDEQVGKLMSLKPSTTINADSTANYVKTNVADPMRKTLQESTMPAIRQQTKNLWGSARAAMENKALTDTENAIAQKSADIGYQDEQARRGLAESAYGRAASLYPNVDAENKLLNLVGTKTKENIATQSPDSWDKFMQIAGLGVGAAGALGKLGAK
jgi:hypothetical protein